MLKRIWWYHINGYSNVGTKGLLAITIIMASLASLSKPGCMAFAFMAYLMLICDRGFGEPKYEDWA